MAQVIIDIHDDHFEEYKLLMSIYYGYEEYVYDEESDSYIPNPQTRGAFAKQSMITEMKERALQVRRKIVMNEANITELDIS